MKYTFLILGLLSILACGKKKNACDNIYCDPSAFGPYFAFTIKAKISGQNYFFSSPPLYPFSALKISDLQHDTLPFHIYVDTISASFRVAGTKAGDNTLLLTIDGAKPDTLRYKASFYSLSCCSTGAVMTGVYLNSQLVTQQFDAGNGGKSPTPILTLYKD